MLANAEIKAKLKVVKVDKETGNIIARSGIKFKIFDVDNNEYVCQTTDKVQCEFMTNEDGILMTPLPLSSGTYKLEEVDQALDGYLWNKQSKEFTIGEDSELITDPTYGVIFETQFENEQVKGQVEIFKNGEKVVFENGSYHYEKIKLDGAVFELRASEDIIAGGKKYYSKGELVATLTTDKNGYASLGDMLLPLGKYNLKEVKSNHNNVIDPNTYEFELKTKTDLSTGEPLPNTKIEIFKEDGTKVFEGYTDKDGKIVIDDMPIGKYYLIESEAPEGYVLNTEKQFFEITKDGQIIKSTMTNEKEIEVPNTGINAIDITYVLGGLAILGGIGAIIYEKKKNKK